MKNLFTKMKSRFKRKEIRKFDLNDLRNVPIYKSSSRKQLIEISKEDIIRFIK